MEQDGTMDVKTLRAKFQEQAALKQVIGKPAVPEKPKHIHLPGARTSLLDSINTAVKNKMAFMPRVVFKDPKKEPDDKLPVSCPVPLKSIDSVKESMLKAEALDYNQEKKGDIVKEAPNNKDCLLVWPVSPKQQRSDAGPTAKSLDTKKANLPIKSKNNTKSEAGSAETIQGPANTSSSPESLATTVELVGMEALTLENRDLPHVPSAPRSSNFGSIVTQSPSYDKTKDVSLGSVTPPCDKRVLNALEKAMKKFSPTVSASSSRPESMCSVDEDTLHVIIPTKLCPKLPPIDYEDLIMGVPTDLSSGLPPDSKVFASQAVEIYATPHSAPGQTSSTVKRNVGPGLEAVIPPPKKPLPAFGSFGYLPIKPSRPPDVDLSPYQTAQLEVHGDPALEFLEPWPIAPDDPVLELENSGLEVPEFEVPEFEVPEFQVPDSFTFKHDVLDYGALEHADLEHGASDQWDPVNAPTETEASGTMVHEPVTDYTSNKEIPPVPGLQLGGSLNGIGSIYEDIETPNKYPRADKSRKHKESLKNPYDDGHPTRGDGHKTLRFPISRNEQKESPEVRDEKEQKKKGKQRLEKQKREQKEREKKENEMKKRFKITGQEESMYQAKVTVASKGRKDNLPVKSGENVSIIRTTNCPKGKWLAKDSNNKYGYISVKNVELDIKEMLELGKKASQAAAHSPFERETIGKDRRSSNNNPLSVGSFSDDSEEWTCDDDDETSTPQTTDMKEQSQTASIPEMGEYTSKYNSEQVTSFLISDHQVTPVTANHANPQHTVWGCRLGNRNIHEKQEALQKLTTFFEHQSGACEIITEDVNGRSKEENPSFEPEAVYLSKQEEDIQQLDTDIIPPPELYADSADN